MPTPFTHLACAQRLLVDEHLPTQTRVLLDSEKPAFLLGNIAADARISGGVTREATHFFAYDRPIEDRPWRVMLLQHPQLQHPLSPGQTAFLAGYVAHLCLDEIWSLDIVRPYFAGGAWGDRKSRFLMLHMILVYMDDRDYRALEAWQRTSLSSANPKSWTPFLTDTTLIEWRDFIGTQIPPGGESLTLQVFGERINQTPADLARLLADEDRMQRDLWDNVPHVALAQAEARMYTHARTEMLTFLAEV